MQDMSVILKGGTTEIFRQLIVNTDAKRQ